jgi:hypothetical protein
MGKRAHASYKPKRSTSRARSRDLSLMGCILSISLQWQFESSTLRANPRDLPQPILHHPRIRTLRPAREPRLQLGHRQLLPRRRDLTVTISRVTGPCSESIRPYRLNSRHRAPRVPPRRRPESRRLYSLRFRSRKSAVYFLCALPPESKTSGGSMLGQRGRGAYP